MSFEIKTNKEYFILVNREELLELAEQYGYESCSLFTKKAFSEEDLAAIKNSNPIVVLIFQFDDGDDEPVYDLIKQLKNNGIAYSINSLSDNAPYGADEKPDYSLKAAITVFPRIEELEEWLEHRGDIRTTDYQNRCGNCHQPMEEDDLYCRHCGTKRGDGSFLPYKNVFDVLYGPPSKFKYKCSKCGQIWVGTAFDPASRYCPHCGGDHFDSYEYSDNDDLYFFAELGYKDPYEPGLKPVLFEDSEIVSLLNHRGISDDMEEYCEKANVEYPGQGKEFGDRRLTELEAEKRNQIKRIAAMKGIDYESNYRQFGSCPKCGSKYLAAVEYKLFDDQFNNLGLVCREGVSEEALKYNYGSGFSEKDDIENLDLLCLKCGSIY